MGNEDLRREKLRHEAQQAEADEQRKRECEHEAYEPRLENEEVVTPDDEPPYIRVELTCSNCELYHEEAVLKPHPDDVPDGETVPWSVEEVLHAINGVQVNRFTDIDASLAFHLLNESEGREHTVVVPCYMA